MIYDCDFFIKMYEAIPGSLWCTGSLSKGKKRCAFGHCDENRGAGSEAGKHLSRLFSMLGTKERQYPVAYINDGDDERYQQSTAKQRILAALYDIKKLNQGTGTQTERRNEVKSELPSADYKNITSELATLPPEEVSDLKKVFATEDQSGNK